MTFHSLWFSGSLLHQRQYALKISSLDKQPWNLLQPPKKLQKPSLHIKSADMFLPYCRANELTISRDFWDPIGKKTRETRTILYDFDNRNKRNTKHPSLNESKLLNSKPSSITIILCPSPKTRTKKDPGTFAIQGIESLRLVSYQGKLSENHYWIQVGQVYFIILHPAIVWRDHSSPK